jgi:hypothetical protein
MGLASPFGQLKEGKKREEEFQRREHIEGAKKKQKRKDFFDRKYFSLFSLFLSCPLRPLR